ncbi:MAG: cytochrome c556 [Halioglobus sp.]|jgi:cytochrome c556
MANTFNRTAVALLTVIGIGLSPGVTSHYDDKEVLQSYRQSWFTMVAVNFGPMVGMIQGKMAWNDEQMKASADQLATLASMDIAKGFSVGSEKGTTRAKPEIWENKADFEAKMDDMKKAAFALQAAVATGDKDSIGKAVGAAGKSCKSCHDEYKSKDYLY